MQIKEIQTREDIASTYQVLRQIYDDLIESTYIEDVLNMMERGYKMAAVFEDNEVENGRCIGAIGIRVIRKLRFAKAVEVEDFIIHRARRGIGVGKMLIRWIEWQAAIFGCHNIVGSLETKRQESQKIFSREKFLIDGLFFKKTYQ